MSVTALILSYNRVQFIEQALKSIESQSYTDWNLVLSDCSDDQEIALEIRHIFESFKAKHPDKTCKLLRHPHRLQQATHLSNALHTLSSTYVALLDDDDYWNHDHLSRAIEWLEQDTRNGITLSNGQIVDDRGKEHGLTNPEHTEIPNANAPRDWLYWILRKYYGSTSGFVLRRESLIGWSFPNFPCIDIHIILGILVNGYNCRGYPTPTYFYREHEQSNYAKGTQVFKDRHEWRLWLARNHGVKITKRCPTFPLLVLKSILSLLISAKSEATPRSRSHDR